jgi:hypothetical protein
MSDVVVLDGRPSREAARRAGMRRVLTDIGLFGEALFDLPLREYQLRVARAVLDSVARRRGLTITVRMPRQAGKNELSARLEAFLLARHQRAGGSLGK